MGQEDDTPGRSWGKKVPMKDCKSQFLGTQIRAEKERECGGERQREKTHQTRPDSESDVMLWKETLRHRPRAVTRGKERLGTLGQEF